MNPGTPELRALKKLHKHNASVRPVVGCNCPAYKAATQYTIRINT